MIRSVVFSAVTLAVCSVAGSAYAQSFNRSGQPNRQAVQTPWAHRTPQTITQSTSATVAEANSISCNAGEPAFLHTDNSYYRAFTLASFPALTLPQFRVDSVTFGVQTANDADGAGQPVTVKLWRSSANPPTLSSLTALTSDTVTVPDSAAGTLVTVPITAPPVLLVASDILVVEILTPDGRTTNNSFFLGSNAGGQSAPSFIRAEDCEVSEITDLADIGFDEMHIVLSVSGNNQVPVSLQQFQVD